MEYTNEYIAFPEIQKYMESSDWDRVAFDPDKNLWFVPKDMTISVVTGIVTRWKYLYESL